MPHDHRTEVQVTPSSDPRDVQAFCSSYYPNGRREYEPNGLSFIRAGDTPVQMYPHRPFFWIRTKGEWVPGNLWDWIVVGPTEHGDEYFVVPDHVYQHHHRG